MNNSEQRFQSFVTRVRPHRAAVFINIADPHWQHSCLGIIDFFSKLWGGSHCVIIPTDGRTINEEFWAILSSYDPDVLYRYQPTAADLKIRDPAELERIMTAEAESYASSGIPFDEARRAIESSVLELSIDPWSISDELQQQILIRLSPFHFEADPTHGRPKRELHIYAINRGSNPNHPLTRIIDVLPSTKKPVRVIQIVPDTDDESAPPHLWLAATLGSGDSKYFARMKAIDIVPEQIALSHYSSSEIIRWGINPQTHFRLEFPFGLSRAALSSTSHRASRRFELPTVVVVGDSLKDFCLFRALYWQQGRALWLPSWFMPKTDTFPDRLVTAVRETAEAGRAEHNESLLLVSYSVPESELGSLQKTISSYMFRTSVSIQAITTKMVCRHLEHPIRLYAERNIGDLTTHMLVDNNLPGWFDSPVPRTLHPVDALSHRWIVDLTFLNHLLPRHPAIGALVFKDSNLGDVRAANEGVSYMCPGCL